MIITPSYSFTRPANTTAYAAGDLVANSTASASVVPMSFDCSRYGAASNGKIVGVRAFKDNEATGGASFNLLLFSASPTVSVEDNAAFNLVSAADFIGAEGVLFSTGGSTAGTLASTTDISAYVAVDPAICFDVGSQKLYGLLTAASTYTPASGETFTVQLCIEKGMT